MGFYLKHGSKFVKRSKNRRLPGLSAILGTKAQAKIYASETSAKKAKTTHEFQYRKELRDSTFEIVKAPVKRVKKDNDSDEEE